MTSPADEGGGSDIGGCVCVGVRAGGKLRWAKTPAGSTGGGSSAPGSPWEGAWTGTDVRTLSVNCTGSMCPTISPAYCDPTSASCRQTSTDTYPPITLRGSATRVLTVHGASVTGQLTLLGGFPTIGLPPPNWGHGCEVAKRGDAHIVLAGTLSGQTLQVRWYHVGHADAAQDGTLTLQGGSARGSLGDYDVQLMRG